MIVSVIVWMLIHLSMEVAINEVVTNTVCPDKCNHHGDCHVSTSVAFCECHVGWGGHACELPCDRPCRHGSCVFAGQKQMCLCSPGYRGDSCTEIGFDLSALLNLAKLISVNSVYSLPLVVDPSEQVQANIQRGSNNCTGNFVCQNGGRCVNGHMGGYRCQCDRSRVTGNFCQYTCTKPCLNGGTCVRMRRSGSKADFRELLSLPESQAVYRCICEDGFSGERCHRSLHGVPSSGT